MKRETYKTFKFEEREFRIGKFDAFTGSYIAWQLMYQILPMGIKLDGMPSAPPGSKTMSKTEFVELQTECLKVCAEMLPAGDAPIINENGSWGIEDIKHNAPMALALTVQALTWNVADFFDENLLQALATGFVSLNKQNA